MKPSVIGLSFAAALAALIAFFVFRNVEPPPPQTQAIVQAQEKIHQAEARAEAAEARASAADADTAQLLAAIDSADKAKFAGKEPEPTEPVYGRNQNLITPKWCPTRKSPTRMGRRG
jgi:hypothetical protein